MKAIAKFTFICSKIIFNITYSLFKQIINIILYNKIICPVFNFIIFSFNYSNFFKSI